MSTTEIEQEPQALAHQQEVAGLLPVLAQLDKTAAELESGQNVSAAHVTAYQTQAAHARHLLDTTGASATEVAEAEKQHRGDGDAGFAARGLDHATNTRHYEPTETTDSSKERDRDDEEIDL